MVTAQEARWAAFFDRAGISYQFHPSGIEVGATPFVPSFYFPEEELYALAKPMHLGGEAGKKEEPEYQDVKLAMQFVDHSINRLVLLPDLPPAKGSCIFWYAMLFYDTVDRAVKQKYIPLLIQRELELDMIHFDPATLFFPIPVKDLYGIGSPVKLDWHPLLTEDIEEPSRSEDRMRWTEWTSQGWAFLLENKEPAEKYNHLISAEELPACYQYANSLGAEDMVAILHRLEAMEQGRNEAEAEQCTDSRAPDCQSKRVCGCPPP